MVTLSRIICSEDANLPRLLKLYEQAFPLDERRKTSVVYTLIDSCEDMHFNAIMYNDTLAGFSIYWDMKDYFYLEHFAVFPEMRNHNIGTQVLAYLSRELKGLRILEVEPDADALTHRRIEFYKRNGYEVLDKDYIQPSYHCYDDACKLWIMGSEKSSMLPDYIKSIHTNVYRKYVPLEQ